MADSVTRQTSVSTSRSDLADANASARAKAADGSAPAGQRVPSVERAVRILSLVASEQGSVSLAGLSKRLALPRSSTLALCNTLVAERLLARDATGAYRLGPHVLALGHRYLAQTDLLNEFQRAHAESVVLPELTLVLGVLDGPDVVYVGRRAGLKRVVMPYETGMRLPANCTATGKALLSEHTAEQLQAIFGHAPEALPALTSRSITRLDTLLGDLATVRERGWSTDDDETALGMFCVGAPIRDDGGAIAGAVAATTVKSDVRPTDLPAYASAVQQLARRISLGLGWRPNC